MRTLIHHSDPTNMNVCRNKEYTRYLTIKENAMDARVSLPGDITLNFPLVLLSPSGDLGIGLV